MMEKRDDRLVSFIIAIALFCGFIIGLAVGFNSARSERDKWADMYDSHINKQWRMIEQRDSVYMHYLQIRLHCEKYDNQ
ncbi:MAG: hypothetical protein Q4A15_11485 [Prevotellaceae bacterium]|nr:hypothetical protein [Prevotellaceae bacterium]